MPPRARKTAVSPTLIRLPAVSQTPPPDESDVYSKPVEQKQKLEEWKVDSAQEQEA